MSRRISPTLVPYRKTRQIAYDVARTMGNWQPVVDFLATGNVEKLTRGLVRRGVRRLAGRAYSRMSFGLDGGPALLLDIAVMVLGRLVGFRGRL